MIENELLGAEELDIKFSYPEDYIVFLPHMEEIDNTSWWLIGTSKGFFYSCFNFVNEELQSKKLLIPFAKCDESNIFACFDEESTLCTLLIRTITKTPSFMHSLKSS